MVKRWPKFLDLQIKLPEPGELVALEQMKSMCPGREADQVEIREVCREMSCRTPFWRGTRVDMDIPERVLSPVEVYVINCKYLELNAAFHAKRREQNTRGAIAEAEQNLRHEQSSRGR